MDQVHKETLRDALLDLLSLGTKPKKQENSGSLQAGQKMILKEKSNNILSNCFTSTEPSTNTTIDGCFSQLSSKEVKQNQNKMKKVTNNKKMVGKKLSKTAKDSLLKSISNSHQNNEKQKTTITDP